VRADNGPAREKERRAHGHNSKKFDMNVIKGSSIGLMSIVLHSDAQAQGVEDTMQLERMIF
jgi:hypothetical protein